MNISDLQPIVLTLCNERSVRRVLDTIVQSLAAQEHTALARIWLMESGGPSGDNQQCLRLAASDGYSREPEQARWRECKGAYQVFQVGERKVGRIISERKPLLLTNVGEERGWLRDPEWAEREGVLSFAGQPLIFRGEALGVLAIFSREILTNDEMAVLRTFADHAAASVANARAFEEIESLRRRLELENEYLREEALEVHSGGEILGESSAILKVLKQIELVAPTESTVLIEGESGTGKELIARAIHQKSERAHRPMIKVNCASISKDLFESEFFGHVRGAFTGALKDRQGRFELADGGTLFLDEVGEIPLTMQGKLLRVIQEGEFDRVGDESTRRVDVRIIAATNRDLKRDAEVGEFRQDLYFRLSVFPIASPALRDRLEDIPPLAARFLNQAARRLGRLPPNLKQRHVMELQQYSWPGNVRELQNVMERAAIRAQDGVVKLDLPDTAASTDSRMLIADTEAVESPFLTYPQLNEFERENLRKALEQANWKIAGQGGAAELLCANPTTLASRVKRFGLKKPSRLTEQ